MLSDASHSTFTYLNRLSTILLYILKVKSNLNPYLSEDPEKFCFFRIRYYHTIDAELSCFPDCFAATLAAEMTSAVLFFASKRLCTVADTCAPFDIQYEIRSFFNMVSLVLG